MNKHTSDLRTVLIEIEKLKLYERNPRIHSAGQINGLKKSISEFGFNNPVLIDEDNNVVAGHGRIAAAQQLGMLKVPATRLCHLSPNKLRAFAIADNRIAEAGASWDDALLAGVLLELSSADLDFSLDAIGFSTGEIDLRIESLNAVTETKPEVLEDIPAIAAEAVTHQDDVWICGHHRIYCGDALDRESYKRLMRGKLARLVFADPPFNLQVDGLVSGKGKLRHREFAMGSGEWTTAEHTDFLSRVFSHGARNSKSGSIHFYSGDWRHLTEYVTAGNECFSELKNLCVWKKHNAGMGSFYRSQHELFFVFKHGTSKHANNVELGKNGRSRSNIWEFPGASNFGRSGEDADLSSAHPTPKPVALVAEAILDCSKRGDIVLDSFLGSGTTLLAAERVGRTCYGMEIDPLYCDLAIRRWQRHCGDHAVLERTGQRFDDISSGEKVRKK